MPADPGKGPVFFLSYARADDSDSYIRKFHADLCAAVAALLGPRLPSDEDPTGFRDGSHIPVGADWSSWITRMLNTCRCMVACYSEAYFSSANCSREVQVILRRMRDGQDRGGTPSVHLMPVLWTPTAVPAELTMFQYTTDGLGRRYAEVGMRGLLLERHTGPDYRDAVRFIAQQLEQADEGAGMLIQDDHSAPFDQRPLSFQPRSTGRSAAAGPGRPPGAWHVPTRNARFTGRSALLQALGEGFAETAVTGPLPRVLVGVGGVGKTQTAIEFAHRSADQYDLVWQLDAGQPELVRRQLAEMAAPLGLPVSDDVPGAAAAVLECLRRGDPCPRWLVVMDNAEDPAALRGLIPTGPGHVLLTSRNSNWAELAEQIDIDVFDRHESELLLRAANPALDRADAGKIAEVLGDFPLAVAQAAVLLREAGIPAPVFLDLLHARLSDLLSEPAVGGYPRSARATWLLALDRLRGANPAAAELLLRCAFLGPASIPLQVLYTSGAVRLLGDTTTALDVAALVREINRHGLARLDVLHGTLTMHRLVQQVLRQQVPTSEQPQLRRQAHQLLAAANPHTPDAPETWDLYAALLAHLVPSDAVTSRSEEVRTWIADTVRYLWRRSELDAAVTMAEHADSAWQPAFGDTDPLVLYLRTQWVDALRLQGRLGEAHELGSDTYRRCRDALGPDHLYTLMAATGHGADLRALGEYRKALETDAETYPACLRVFGGDHLRTLFAANNLAVSLCLNGDLRAAHELYRKGVPQQRELLGHENPDALYASANYAYALRESGALAEAREMLEHAHTSLVTQLGEKHLYTLHTARNRAAALRRSGLWADAREAAQDVHTVAAEAFGVRHPETLAGATALMCAQVSDGDAVSGRQLGESTHDLHRALLGPRHPLTLVCAVNLAVGLRRVHATGEAATLSGEALALLREVLGNDHPYTQAALVNHASILAARSDGEDLAEAVALGREALTRAEATGRLLHPDAIACAANLADDLLAADRAAEARALRAEARERSRTALGADHPVTALVVSGARIDCFIEPPAV